MADRAQLQANVTAAKSALAAAEDALASFDEAPENNVFASMGQAKALIEEVLLDQAYKDCSGAHNCGADAYTRTFIVDGVRYVGTLSVEYNRHDKTYYYVDGYSFDVQPEVAA